MKSTARADRRPQTNRIPTRRPAKKANPLCRLTGLGCLFALFVLGLGTSLFFLKDAAGWAGLALQSAKEVAPLPFSGESAAIWRGTERVNLLLIGLDHRGDEAEEYARADTMIVATLDPVTRKVGLLSVPRDLWVSIPVGDKKVVEDRVNASYVYGATYNTPGGGPALAKKTVEQVLGIKIHYTARVDFTGFVKAVDSLGGLTIDVEGPLKDNEYPTADYRTQRIYFPPGLQHMTGEQALMYARSRHQDSDLARANRQQKVLLAARQRALQLDLLPRLPKLVADFRDVINTDLSATDIIGLARILKDVDTKNVTVRTVPSTPMVTSTGAEVLALDKKSLGRVVGEVFNNASLAPELVSIEVLNATTTNGLATRTAGFLKDKGLSVVRFDTATESRTETVIYSTTASHKTAEYVAQLLGVPASRVQDRAVDSGAPDVRVVLGKDVTFPAN